MEIRRDFYLDKLIRRKNNGNIRLLYVRMADFYSRKR